MVTYGKSRTEALEAMTTALDNYVIRGVAHNIPLLRDITRESSFRKGDIATDYLPKVYPEGFKGCALTSQERSALLLVASALHARKINRNRTIEPSRRSEVRYTATFHELGTKSESKEVVFHGISENRNSQEMFVNGKSTIITGDLTTSKLVLDLNVDGLSLSVQYVSRTTSTISLSFKGTLFTIDVHPQHSSGYLELMKPKKTVDNSSSVISPMPGAVKVVNVKVGDVVSEGQELIVLEAMKMQNSLVAGKSGKVKTVCTKVGDTVEEGEILVELL
ncbi:unnamed protein product [Caenorhabditis auriculariae]|uniref:propionyl-CoA carboxylase n=1 Tax=Caenorhabditis auriculariae TaxID=2777116 RepID=A0A8S1I0U8_9PELO|nr:unnamed protein product [Caenorhabditis auriculariae]